MEAKSAESQQVSAGESHLTASAELAVTACPTCGVAFAIPAGLFFTRQKTREPVHCPSGHAHALAVPTDDDLTAANFELSVQVLKLNHELAEARSRKPSAPSGPVPDDRVQERIRYLVARAELSNLRPGPLRQRMLICPLCQKVKRDQGLLKDHLRKIHFEQIRELPEERFK